MMSAPQQEPQEAAEPCGVCLEAVQTRGVLDCCEHIFCLDCILGWAQKESRCPVCRRRMTTVTQPGAAPVPIPRKNQVFEFDGVLMEDESDALDDVRCDVCNEGDREDELLLCRRFEVCGASAHASCLGLREVPDEDWECYCCAASSRRRERVTAARVSALASPAATGVTPEEQARMSGEYRWVSGDAVDLECPPSPRDDEATVQRWVARQRTIASTTDAAVHSPGLNAASRQLSSLRTIRQFRDNWAAIRDGRVSFEAIGSGRARAHTGTASRGSRAARTRGTPAPAATMSDAPAADASQLSWHALEELRRQEEQRARRQASRGAAAGPRRVESSRIETQRPADGFLQHLAGMRRARESSQLDTRPRATRRLEQQAQDSRVAREPQSGAPARLSFVIPRNTA